MDHLHPYIPIAMMLLLAVVFATLNLFLRRILAFALILVGKIFRQESQMRARVLGKERFTPSKLTPYESGIVPTGEANVRIPIKFYMVAILFLLFDIEAVFILSWAVIFRGKGLFDDAGKAIIQISGRSLDFTQGQFQWFAFAEMLTFILILMVGYAYIWKKGGFRWS